MDYVILNSQPGVYGRIDIGNHPQPVLVSPQPAVVAPAPLAVYQQPIYLDVPVVYQQNWGRYCGRYNACVSLSTLCRSNGVASAIDRSTIANAVNVTSGITTATVATIAA